MGKEKFPSPDKSRREFLKKTAWVTGGAAAAGAGITGIYKWLEKKEKPAPEPEKKELPKEQSYEDISKAFQKLAPKISLADLGIGETTDPNLFFSMAAGGLMQYSEIKKLVSAYLKRNKLQGIFLSFLQNPTYYLERLNTDPEGLIKRFQISGMLLNCFIEQNYFFNPDPRLYKKVFARLKYEGIKSLSNEQSRIIGEVFIDSGIEPKLDYSYYIMNNDDFGVLGLNVNKNLILNEVSIKRDYEKIYNEHLSNYKWEPAYRKPGYNLFREEVLINELAGIFFSERYNDFSVEFSPHGQITSMHVSEFISDVASFRINPGALFNRLHDWLHRVIWKGSRTPGGAPITENYNYGLTINLFAQNFVEILIKNKIINNLSDFENELRAKFIAKCTTYTEKKAKFEVVTMLFKLLHPEDLQDMQNKMTNIAKDILAKIAVYKK